MNYIVRGKVTITVYTCIEAESKEEAIEMVEDEGMEIVYKNWVGDDKPDGEFWATEFDGEVQDLTAIED